MSGVATAEAVVRYTVDTSAVATAEAVMRYMADTPAVAIAEAVAIAAAMDTGATPTEDSCQGVQ